MTHNARGDLPDSKVTFALIRIVVLNDPHLANLTLFRACAFGRVEFCVSLTTESFYLVVDPFLCKCLLCTEFRQIAIELVLSVSNLYLYPTWVKREG